MGIMTEMSIGHIPGVFTILFASKIPAIIWHCSHIMVVLLLRARWTFWWDKKGDAISWRGYENASQGSYDVDNPIAATQGWLVKTEVAVNATCLGSG